MTLLTGSLLSEKEKRLLDIRFEEEKRKYEVAEVIMREILASYLKGEMSKSVVLKTIFSVAEKMPSGTSGKAALVGRAFLEVMRTNQTTKQIPVRGRPPHPTWLVNLVKKLAEMVREKEGLKVNEGSADAEDNTIQSRVAEIMNKAGIQCSENTVKEILYPRIKKINKSKRNRILKYKKV